jgi:hypothetical protein
MRNRRNTVERKESLASSSSHSENSNNNSCDIDMKTAQQAASPRMKSRSPSRSPGASMTQDDEIE